MGKKKKWVGKDWVILTGGNTTPILKIEGKRIHFACAAVHGHEREKEKYVFPQTPPISTVNQETEKRVKTRFDRFTNSFFSDCRSRKRNFPSFLSGSLRRSRICITWRHTTDERECIPLFWKERIAQGDHTFQMGLYKSFQLPTENRITMVFTATFFRMLKTP